MLVKKAAGLLVLILGVTIAVYFSTSRESNTVYDPPIKHIDPASPCPWRDAETDMTNWFPGATQYQPHDLILSDKRTELRAKLGRELQPEEMALHMYLIKSNDLQVGSVLTRRIKAAHGAIELAVAVDPEKKVRAVKIQRIREPESILNDLAQFHLERRFAGYGLNNDFTLKEGEPRNSAYETAQAIASDVRACLVLFNAGYSKNHVSQHH